MDLKIFNEKIVISKEEFKDNNSQKDMESMNQLFNDGENALSLNDIIRTRLYILDHLIFEIDQTQQ